MTEIETCLNCKKPFCDNCLDGIVNARVNRIPQVLDCIERGMRVCEMARELGIDKSTVRYWLKKAGVNVGQKVER